jgi:hypothetical protein
VYTIQTLRHDDVHVFTTTSNLPWLLTPMQKTPVLHVSPPKPFKSQTNLYTHIYIL